MIELKTAHEIDKMAVTAAVVADTLATLSIEAEPGVNLMQLEHHARTLIADRGAQSCYWDYAPSFGRGPFRNVICLSVNDAVLHGMPHDYVLRDGDVLSLDFAVSIDGWVADAAVTVIVGGTADAADAALIESTQRALEAGIAAAVPGGRLGDVSAAIGEVATAAGYRVNAEFEPWWSRGSDRLAIDADGWTLRSADGSNTAHSEHTIAITEAGPRVLTQVSAASSPRARQRAAAAPGQVR